MRKYIFASLIIVLLAVACNKDKKLQKATIVDTGDVAKDGCGYLLKLEEDGRMVRPNNIPSAYMHNGYKVKVSFDENGEGIACKIYPMNDFIEEVQLTVIKADID